MTEDKPSDEVPRFSFGTPCPPIASWFFPNDPEKEPHEIADDKEERPAQPS